MSAAMEKGERIAKRLARAGLCSRREAEHWIAQGRVSVGGKVLDSPAVTVLPGDEIRVDGKLIPAAEPARLWRYHKPPGLVTTRHDEEGRPTVFDSIPPELPRVVSVGRLAFKAEGLLLLTNDGSMVHDLESRGWLRRYRLRVHSAMDMALLDSYGASDVTIDDDRGANVWLSVSLPGDILPSVTGDDLGFAASRIICIAHGPFQLCDLERGEVEEVPNIPAALQR